MRRHALRNANQTSRGFMLMAKPCVLFLFAVAAFFSSQTAFAARHKPRVVYRDPRIKTPSSAYGALSKAACLKQLSARKIPYSEVRSARGVLAPIRLGGPVGGVLFRIDTPATKNLDARTDVVDCRLALALSDFAKLLNSKGIDEVSVASAWRPPEASWPRGKTAKRHPGALAIDVKRFGKKAAKGETSKQWIVVEKDFQGKMGTKVCGKAAVKPRTADGQLLRSIVCDAAKANLFTSILTPNYNRAHRDHLHLEITEGVAWTLLL